MKQLSCGILITDGKSVLGCLPTGRQVFDIIKGRQEEGETFSQTAIREAKEETGLIIKENQLEDLGHFQYIKTKDLHLFKMKVEKMPDTKKLKCSSYFTIGTKSVPEMNGYEIINFSEIDKFMPSMKIVIEKALKIGN